MTFEEWYKKQGRKSKKEMAYAAWIAGGKEAQWVCMDTAMFGNIAKAQVPDGIFDLDDKETWTRVHIAASIMQGLRRSNVAGHMGRDLSSVLGLGNKNILPEPRKMVKSDYPIYWPGLISFILIITTLIILGILKWAGI